MPEAVAVSVAKAVVAQIVAARSTLSKEFTLERSYADWEKPLDTMEDLALRESDKLRVDVVGHMTEQTAALSSRTSVQIITPIDIAVREKFGPDKQDDDTGRIELARVDELMLLTQELYLMFMPQRLTSFPGAVWDAANGGTKILAAPVKAHLRDLRQFTGLIRVVFRADVNV